MIIGLASPRVATSLDDGLETAGRLLADAAGRGAQIVCFPEAYLPGLRGQDFDVPPFGPAEEERALREVAELARTHGVAVIMGMERITDAGRQIAACVIDREGRILGWQTKNQLDPSEDAFYVPGHTRRLFEIGGLRFGVAICHEGWRYPETVRWAAVRGAHVVFHPQLTGSHAGGFRPAEWGAADGPYYEKAMMMRSRENTIYFASVNYALPFPESATSLIAPSGECQAYLPYGEEGVLVLEIDLRAATGLLGPAVRARTLRGRGERWMTEDAAVPGSLVIREARVEDADAISGLIMSLGRYFLTDPEHPEAAAAFWPTIGPAAIADALGEARYRYHVAEVDGVLAGVVGVRDGSHLYHLFVAEPFHGRGIGARLWETARRDARARGNPGRFTVNSSRHAIGMYERMGFVATDGLQVMNGIEYLPMQLVESD